MLGRNEADIVEHQHKLVNAIVKAIFSPFLVEK